MNLYIIFAITLILIILYINDINQKLDILENDKEQFKAGVITNPENSKTKVYIIIGCISAVVIYALGDYLWKKYKNKVEPN